MTDHADTIRRELGNIAEQGAISQANVNRYPAAIRSLNGAHNIARAALVKLGEQKS